MFNSTKFDKFVKENAPTACKGIMLAVAMSAPVIFGVATGLFAMSPFGAFGAMVTILIAPRRGPWIRIAGVMAGCCMMVLAASISDALTRHPILALLFLFVLSWLFALAKKEQKYVSMVIKCTAIAGLISFFDFHPSRGMGLYFLFGVIWGLFICLADMAFETEGKEYPLKQLRDFIHGDINNVYYSLAVPITVVSSTMAAYLLAFSEPAWVGLTVLIVSDMNEAAERKKIFERAAGTLVGTIITFLIVKFINQPLQLTLVAAFFTFFIPFSKSYYALFSMIITCLVLLFIDVAMSPQGGDMKLLYWRFFDTAFGCLCVLVANVILKFVHKRKDTVRTF